MAIGYIDRDGSEISKQQWAEKKADPNYTTVHAYDNGAIRLSVEWIGRLDDYKQVFPDYYKVFVLKLQNYTSEGKLVDDPAFDRVWFPNQQDAIKRYESMLVEMTESGYDSSGKFVEQDNQLTPPPPPDPNKPQQEPDNPELGGVGAW